MDNPYQTTASSKLEKIQSPFGFPYWLALIALGAGFVLMLPFVPAVGLIGIGGFGFASLRTHLYSRLIAKGELRNASERLSGPWLPFLLTSYACGLLATVAACVGFLTVCIPTGAAIFSIGSPLWPDSVGIIIIVSSVVAAIVVSVFAGGLVVRWTLPRREPIHALDEMESLVVDPRTKAVSAKPPSDIVE